MQQFISGKDVVSRFRVVPNAQWLQRWSVRYRPFPAGGAWIEASNGIGRHHINDVSEFEITAPGDTSLQFEVAAQHIPNSGPGGVNYNNGQPYPGAPWTENASRILQQSDRLVIVGFDDSWSNRDYGDVTVTCTRR